MKNTFQNLRKKASFSSGDTDSNNTNANISITNNDNKNKINNNNNNNNIDTDNNNNINNTDNTDNKTNSNHNNNENNRNYNVDNEFVVPTTPAKKKPSFSGLYSSPESTHSGKSIPAQIRRISLYATQRNNANIFDDKISSPDYLSLEQILARMMVGTHLLKAGKIGNPHYREFSLSKDLQRLQWKSPNRYRLNKIYFEDVNEFVLGQKTKTFLQNQNPNNEELSFSLIYKKENTLDIICKDKFEFELWAIGLKALLALEGENSDIDIVSVKQYYEQYSKTIRQSNFASRDEFDILLWGSGTYGTAGVGSEDDVHVPLVVEALLGKNIVLMAMGAAHNLALTSTYQVFSWGRGLEGTLGIGSERNKFTPLEIKELRTTESCFVAAGNYHSVSISGNGDFFTWGSNTKGQLGYKTSMPKQLVPKLVSVDDLVAGDKIVFAACGDDFTIALSDFGYLYATGSNESGQLGINDNSVGDLSYFVRVPCKEKILMVVCGTFHTAAISELGDLYTWGSGSGGELGYGNKNVATPTIVNFFSDQNIKIMDVDCGEYQTIVLTEDGAVYWFGEDLGSNTSVEEIIEIKSPKLIEFPPNASAINQVACGSGFCAALTSQGRIYTWGLGDSGQLGIGKTTFSDVPVEIVADYSVREITLSGSRAGALIDHQWVPDENVKGCMLCKVNFTAVKRRHHCRKCGGVFCGSCTSKRYPIIELGYTEPVRVCDKCHHVLTN